MRDINEVAKKMVRNGFEIAKSSGCAFHFESEFNRRKNSQVNVHFNVLQKTKLTDQTSDSRSERRRALE